jgi:hypothetical protein
LGVGIARFATIKRFEMTTSRVPTADCAFALFMKPLIRGSRQSAEAQA